MQETVTVQYVNDPQKYPNWASIKTDNNEYISVPAGQQHQFSKGGTYTIEVEQSQNGRKTFKGFAQPPQQQNYQQPVAGSNYQPPAQQAPQLTQVEPIGGPIAGVSDWSSKEESMAVMGILGRCFQGTGQLPPTMQLEALMRSVRTAWRGSCHDSGTGTQNDAPPQHGPAGPDRYDGPQDPFAL